MVSTVRAEIIRSLKEESEQYADALGNALQNASKEIANINLNSDFLNDYADVIDVVKNLVVFLPVGGPIARVVTFVLTHLPAVAKVINWLFGKSNEDIEREVLQKLQEAIPTIIEELRDTIAKLVTDNQKRIEEAMQKEYVGKMEHDARWSQRKEGRCREEQRKREPRNRYFAKTPSTNSKRSNRNSNSHQKGSAMHGESIALPPLSPMSLINKPQAGVAQPVRKQVIQKSI